MRDFLNGILAFIGAPSLTDQEFSTITETSPAYTVEVYEELLAVVDSRELVSNTRDRLKYFFLAKDVTVELTSQGVSKILAGAVLED